MAKKKSLPKTAPKKTAPYLYVNSVTASVENEVRSGKLPASDINGFMLLQGLIPHVDTVLLANELNKCIEISDVALYNALHGLIQPKTKRFAPWPKVGRMTENEEVFEFADDHHVGSSGANAHFDFINKSS